MKKIISLTLTLLLSLSILKADYWTQKANFPSQGRSMPLCFSIGNNGYMYGGRATVGGTPLSDFWEYNQPADTWTQKASFPGIQRMWGTSFSIGNKGYMGLGLAGIYIKDFWEYDPAANSWIQKNDFPGGGRYFPVGFTIGSKGYAGMGLDTTGNYASDIWEYNAGTDTWIQKQNFGGIPRATNAAFSVGTKAYVGLGYIIGVPSSGFLDFWEYDMITNAWTQVANFPGTARTQMASFALGNKGYIGTGNQLIPNAVLDDFWEYTPATNSWAQKVNFGGIIRDETAFCAINNKGYIGLGWQNGSNLFNDWWEYTSDSATVIGEVSNSNLQFTISPNPAKEFIIISYSLSGKENLEIIISDPQGKKIFETQPFKKSNQSKISLAGFSNGIYFVTIKNGKEKTAKKFLKE